MKVTETSSIKNRNLQSGRASQLELGTNGKRQSNSLTSEDQPKEAQESTLKSTNKDKFRIQTKDEPNILIKSQESSIHRKSCKNDVDKGASKKSWSPCFGQASKPGVLPAALNTAITIMDSGKACKKLSKSSLTCSSDLCDAEKNKTKHGLENCSGGGDITSVFQKSKNSNVNDTHKTSISSVERRSRVSLKRQFALDKAAMPNMKEANSEESLTSINSVTQLLKIERSAYESDKNRRNGKYEREDEEEHVSGVKSIAAKLEAKSRSSTPTRISTSEKNEVDNSGNKNMLSSNVKQTQQQNQENHGTNKSGNNPDQSGNESFTTSTTFNANKCMPSTGLQNRIDPIQKTTGNLHTTTAAKISDASSSILLKAAMAAVSSSLSHAERKKLNSRTSANAVYKQCTSTPPASFEAQSCPRLSTSLGKGDHTSINPSVNLIESKPSKIRSRSTSPIKSTHSPATVNNNKHSSLASTIAATTKEFKNGSENSSSIVTSETNGKTENKNTRKTATNSHLSCDKKKHLTSTIKHSSKDNNIPATVSTPSSSLTHGNQVKNSRDGATTHSNLRKDTLEKKRKYQTSIQENERKPLANFVNGKRNQSKVSSEQDHVKAPIKNGTTNTIEASHRQRRSRRHENDDGSSSRVMRYAMSTVASRANTNQNQNPCLENILATNVKQSFGTGSASTSQVSLEENSRNSRSRKIVNGNINASVNNKASGVSNRDQAIVKSKSILEENTKFSQRGVSISKLQLNTNATSRNNKCSGGVKENNSKVSSCSEVSSEDVLNYSLSSLSTPSTPSSVTSSPSTSWSSRRKQVGQTRIIPSITMSEYVEGEGKNGKAATFVGHSQSLFDPLQFVEPLKPACDIVEGSSLELKVRVKGAEAVSWVKGNKIIPYAPPYFQYFHEKYSDLYKLRIADVFVEDAGRYTFKAYGAGTSEITCWCEVNVIEKSKKEEDGITGETATCNNSKVLGKVKPEKPLVFPVNQNLNGKVQMNSSSSEWKRKTKEPCSSPVAKTNSIKNLVKTFEDIDKRGSSKVKSLSGRASVDRDQSLAANKPCSGKSSNNESAKFPSVTMKKSKSISSNATTVDICTSTASILDEKVTEFASENVMKETPEEFDYLKKTMNESVIVATTPPVSIVIPAEEKRETPKDNSNKTDCIQNEEEVVGVTSQSHHDHHHVNNLSDDGKGNKCKLTSQLSSASDESIYLKEPRSGDEGALSANEDASGSTLFFDRKNTNHNAINDEDINTVTRESSSVCSPCSEQNGRSSSVDSAIGFLGRPLFSDGKFPPRILVGPSSIIALYGEIVHLRVKVQNYGIPKTSVNWFKFINGTYKKIEASSVANTAAANSNSEQHGTQDAHVSVSKCGASLSTLTITKINYDDCGRYRVKVQNLLGMDSHDCLLTVEGPPEPPTTPPKVKYDEKSKTILIQWSSCPYDGGSKITGYYVEASIVQSSRTAINKDEDHWQLLTPQSYSWLCYTLTEPKRGSVYKFRVFGENIYGKGKPTEPSLPLLVPVLLDGRRAGSSDALLWSLKSLNSEEASLRADSNRNRVVHECENEMAAIDDSVSSQEEEEPVDYKNVTIKRESLHNVYDKLDELGKGRFGVVFEVVDKITKKSYAGKFVKCIKAKDKERVQLEVQIMNDLKYHPKLICLIDAFEMPREIVIVTQRINGGELFERVVADDFTLTEADCITFLRQICDAVGYIHSKNIMHLDLKPENILCTSKTSNSIKIIDFGLAQYYNAEEPIRVLFGTAEFVSPEIINYEPIAPSTDNWSIGVITYILLSGLSPFMGDNDNETFSNITRAEFDFDDEAFEQISEDAKDFISSLIVKRPESRLTAAECLSHQWLKSDDDKKKVVLPTDKLKRFIIRRKWQKTGNAIRALGRITTLYSSRRSSSTSSTPTGSLSMSVSSPTSPHHATPSSRSESLVTQDSVDYDNVFIPNQSHAPVSPTVKTNINPTFTNINNNEPNSNQLKRNSTANTVANRSKYTDPCRSDSGVCDVGSSFSSTSLNYD